MGDTEALVGLRYRPMRLHLGTTAGGGRTDLIERLVRRARQPGRYPALEQAWRTVPFELTESDGNGHKGGPTEQMSVPAHKE